MTAKVITFVNNRERIMFEGLKEDAETFLRNRFPRLHIEPGSGMDPVPDAVLDSDGKRTFYDGLNWADYEPPNQQANTRSAPDGRDARIAELEAQLAAQKAPEVDPAQTNPVEPVDAEIPPAQEGE